jgi:hypothetical protein
LGFWEKRGFGKRPRKTVQNRYTKRRHKFRKGKIVVINMCPIFYCEEVSPAPVCLIAEKQIWALDLRKV